MTADRPYRGAMPQAAAVAELRANTGTQFDPDVVDALIAVLPALTEDEEAYSSDMKGVLVDA
jgi:HD-GYP domain-containing protein (c-di-GMP phosphodiesterase class II)